MIQKKKKEKNLLESLKNVLYDFHFNTQKELNYTLFLCVFQREWKLTCLPNAANNIVHFTVKTALSISNTTCECPTCLWKLY